MDYIKILFSVPSGDTRDILLAHLSQTEMTGIEETEENVTVYYDGTNFPGPEIENLAAGFALKYEQELIKETNWNESWESNFQPVLIDHFCSIRAHFHPPFQNVDHNIVITPKMSFGTGHHATTEMMIRFMREINFSGKKVLDFGTGTGVLAILAEKLDAMEIVAVDHDEWSVNNALENIMENGCSRIAVYNGSLEMIKERNFDLVLANINRHVLLHYMSSISAILAPGGNLLISGILATEDVTIVLEQAEGHGMVFKSKKIKNNWAAMLFQK